jgi:hypothetical protein
MHYIGLNGLALFDESDLPVRRDCILIASLSPRRRAPPACHASMNGASADLEQCAWCRCENVMGMPSSVAELPEMASDPRTVLRAQPLRPLQ